MDTPKVPNNQLPTTKTRTVKAADFGPDVVLPCSAAASAICAACLARSFDFSKGCKFIRIRFMLLSIIFSSVYYVDSFSIIQRDSFSYV